MGFLIIIQMNTKRLLKNTAVVAGFMMFLLLVTESKPVSQGQIIPLKKAILETFVDFKVFIDPVNPVAKITYQDQEFILREKEWSGWKKIRFDFLPTQGVSGICLFYLKEVRPKFKLYVSPINIDPSDPALPISTPDNYSRELANKFSLFLPKDYLLIQPL
jgi:hypothetical protein